MSRHTYSDEDGHPDLNKLDDGTKVRHKYKKGDHSGEMVDAEVQEGHIIYQGKAYSPTGAAREANQDTTGKEYEINGWRWWNYYDEGEKEWVQLSNIRDTNN